METKVKPRMTLFEGVGATILFDLALFGTKNWFINFLIQIFTSFQNSWDTPFGNEQVAKESITEFCQRLSIQQEPWIWDKPIEKYVSLNDFFSRTYSEECFPPLGAADVVAPACCTMRCYNDNATLKNLLIKGCNYDITKIGIPQSDDDSSSSSSSYANHHILIGYLSPSDYHRVHAPISGTVIHLMLEDEQAQSASVKFFDGKFNLLNDNKRLVVVIEGTTGIHVALVIVGGVGVNTIVYDSTMCNNKKTIHKGDWIGSFRAGGSAIALLSNQPLVYTQDFLQATADSKLVEVVVGENLATFG
jgi:phosphatidylserine decarboxylase